MTADDLRTRVREAAEAEYPKGPDDTLADRLRAVNQRLAFIAGALWHAAQRPTREQIARAISYHEMQQCGVSGDGAVERWYQCRGCGHETERHRNWQPEDAEDHSADAVLALLTGDESDE